MKLTPDAKVGYRWYTVGAGWDVGLALRMDPLAGGACHWLKLGPVTFCAYPWYDGRWRVEVHVLNRCWFRSRRLT